LTADGRTVGSGLRREANDLHACASGMVGTVSRSRIGSARRARDVPGLSLVRDQWFLQRPGGLWL